MRKTVNFGLIGCGLMGCAFADAVGRWEGLEADIPKPVIWGVCDPSETARAWFEPLAPQYSTADYRELLAAPDIEAVYCAVPHQLHAQLYTDIIRAGKHLMAEKPFGIDQAACEAILAVLAQHPGVFVRCSSEFPFYPGCSLLPQLRHGFG